jgi:hypothetical protein
MMIIIIIIIIIPWCRIFLQRLIVASCFGGQKKHPRFNGTRRFITYFTDAQLCPSYTKLRYALISHFFMHYLVMRLGPPTGLFYLDFPTKLLYAFLISSVRATYSVHRILPDFIFLIISQRKIHDLNNNYFKHYYYYYYYYYYVRAAE